jgi:penicillin amidase
MTLDALPHSNASLAATGSTPALRFVASANDSVARAGRIAEMLPQSAADVGASRMLQLDTHAWNADRLIPLIEHLSASDRAIDEARQALLAWNRVVGPDGAAAALYVRWEQALRRALVERRIPAELRDEAIARLDDVVTPLARPSNAWFDGDAARARDTLLIDGLGAAVRDRAGEPGTSADTGTQAVTFRHPLAITGPARDRFNVGPFEVPGYAETVFAASPSSGPSLRVVFDASNWDRSIATNAPGQSGSPVSPHFADLARMWAAGEYFPLPFSPEAVSKSAESTLVIVP